MEEIILTGAAFVAVILPFFNLTTWWILRNASAIGEKSKVIEERKNVALILTVASLLLGALGVNRFFEILSGQFLFTSPVPIFILAVVVVLITLPSMLFLKKYLTGEFEGH